MADVNPPSQADISALNTALSELEARLKLVQEDEMKALQTIDEVVTSVNEAGAANLKRVTGQVEINDSVAAELALRTRITAQLSGQIAQANRLLAIDQERVAAARELAGSGGGSTSFIASPGSSSTAGSVAAAGEGAVVGGAAAASRVSAPVVRQTSAAATTAAAADERSVKTTAQLRAEYMNSNAQLASLDNQLTKHGYLTSETIQAAQRGELTYAEWGNQIAGTAAKFGAWTAVSIPIFGAIDAFSKLYDGAVQTSQGLAFVERSIQGLNTDEASKQIRQLSMQFNVPISDASQAMGVMARQFHNQNQAAQAAQAPLFAEKLGDLDINTAANRFTGIAKAFKLPASDLVSIYDQVAQAQRRFGVTADQSTTALATAGGVWKTAGGNLSQLLALTTALNRVTGGGATGANIATMVSYASSQLTNNSSVQARAIGLGIDPTKGIVDVFDQMMKKAESDPQDIKAIAGIFGARGSRYLPALLSNPDFYKQVQQQTSPQASKGVANYELDKMLAGAQEQIKKIGIELENVGSSLMQSGLLTGVALLLHSLIDVLQATNSLVGLWNNIPDPFRSSLATIGEVLLLMRAARAMNAGQGIPTAFGGGPLIGPDGKPTVRGRLHTALTPAEDDVTAKNVLLTARGNVTQARADEASGLQRRSRAQVRNQIVAQQYQDAEANGEDPKTIEALKQRALAAQEVVAGLDAEVQILMRERAYMEATEASYKAQADNAAVVALAQKNGQSILTAAPATGSGRVQVLGGAASEAESAAGGMSGTPVNIVATGGVRTPTTGGAVPTVVAEPPLAGAAAAEGTAAAGSSGMMSSLFEGTMLGSLGSKVSGGAGKLFSGSVMGGLMTYMMGSLGAQLAGGAVGKIAGAGAGHAVSGIGTDAAMGAGIGTVIGPIGTAGGAMIGAGAGIVSDLIGAQSAAQKKQLADLMNTGSARQLQESVAKNGNLAAEGSAGFGGPEGDLAKNNAGTLNALQNLQLDQAKRNPTTPVSGQDISVLMNAAEQQLAAAKTTADKQKVLTTFSDAIDRSYQVMMDGAKGQRAATQAKGQLQAQVDIAGAGGVDPSKVDFSKLYTSLDFSGQTAYDTYLKDIISEQGMGAQSAIGGGAVSQGTDISKMLEGKAANYTKMAATANNKTSLKTDLAQADKYQKEANTITENTLNQNSTQLADALDEAMNPAGITAAYQKATAVAQSQLKVDPVAAKAQIALDAQNYAQYEQQAATARLGLLNAQDPNTVNDAQRTISINNEIAAKMKGVKGEQAQLAVVQAQQNSAAAQSQLLSAQQQEAQNNAQFAQAAAGNNQPLADQAMVTGYQNQISLLQAAHISAAAKAQQMVPLQAQLKQAQLTLFNDTTTWVQNLITAQATLTGDIGNNPVNQALTQLQGAQKITAYGHFKTQADKLNAQATVVTDQQNLLSQRWSELQVQQTLAHDSTSQIITQDEAFLPKIKHDFALRQQIEQTILQDQLSAASSYELNVGNVQLPTAYQVRRAEHALNAPHNQQSIVVHVPITVKSSDGKKAAQEISHHVATAVKTAVRSSQRSGVRRG